MFARLLQSAELWQKLTATQKIALAVAAMILALVVMLVARTASAPRYTQLYGNLTSEDAASVVQKLQEMKVEYRLINGGNSISIPADRVDEVRLSMASQGLPRGGNIGFELFDKSQIGQSEFAERLNYVRAMQGELARTIEQLHTIRSARVHLALPEHRLFSEDQEKATASVVLDLQGPEPTAGEIKSIIHLVASAVQGLQPANVTVVDTQNNLLSDMLDMDGGGATSVRLQAQRTMATQIEGHVQSMLDKVLGPGKSIVRASVKLNYDHKTIERETYTPANGKDGVVESQHVATESYTGAKPGTTGGPVGAVPNTSNAAAIGGTSGSGAYSRNENTTQYHVSKSVEQVEVSPGQIERMTLALFVDDSIKSEQIASLKTTVGTAVGLDATRGDVIEVSPMKFDQSANAAEDKAAKQQARMAQFAMLGKYAGGAVLLIVFLLVVSSIYRTSLGTINAQVRPEDEYARPAAAMMLPGEPAALAAPQQFENMPDMLALHDVTEDEFMHIDPKRVAAVIKEMMTEEA